MFKLIHNQDMGFRRVIDILRSKNQSGFRVEYKNKNRHALLIPDDSKNFRYYAVFKRDFFNTFYMQFPEFAKANKDYCGLGESINKKYIDLALEREVDYLLFIHPDKIYEIPLLFFKKYAEKYSLIRTQDKFNFYHKPPIVVNEITYSVPIELLYDFEN